ncbi:MAG TPA: TetR/AcrR family transcriptional regulator [Candidatus Eisenbacteria bacterium]|nr:TetR/AcrR family transcriptional regulator [Candidatus Eisenbacteria bacterium]
MSTETRTRREREKEEIQRRILDAARDLLASEGPEAVTMRRIADRIEYTPTALYFHFRDKEELLRRLCVEDFGKLAARFQVLSRVADPVERLRMLAKGYVSFALEHPNPYRLIFMTPAPRPADPPPENDSAAERRDPAESLYSFLLQSVTAAVESGRLRPGQTDPHLVAQTLWAGLHGVAALAIANRDRARIEWRPLEERAEAMLNGLLGGLVSEAR